METNSVKINMKTNSVKAWLLATRPKTLTGAFIPVVLASALAHHDGRLDWAVAVMCLLFAGGMQIAANLINDLYDFLRGTDREDRLGPERACAQGWITPAAMKCGIWASIAVSCGFGLCALYLTWQNLPWHGWELVALGASCVIFAFLYTKVFSYYGLGDVLVLVFFGFVPVCGTYYLMTYDLTWQAWLLGAISGIVIDTLLIVNNYRDRDQDRVSGKRTIIVLLGERIGLWLYLLAGLIAAAIAQWLLCSLTAYPAIGGGLLACIYTSLHVMTWLHMKKIHQGRALNAILGETSRNMALMGILLSVALW